MRPGKFAEHGTLVTWTLRPARLQNQHLHTARVAAVPAHQAKCQPICITFVDDHSSNTCSHMLRGHDVRSGLENRPRHKAFIKSLHALEPSSPSVLLSSMGPNPMSARGATCKCNSTVCFADPYISHASAPFMRHGLRLCWAGLCPVRRSHGHGCGLNTISRLWRLNVDVRR